MGDKSDGLTFSLFSRVFFWFLITSSKNFEKTKMKQKIQISRLYKAKYLPQILFVFDFLFFDQKWPKPLRKPKSTQKKQRLGDYMRPDISLKSLFIVFCSFLVFSRLLLLSVKNQKKHRENQKKKQKKTKKPKKTKKTKKTKIRRLYEARHFPQIFGFFVFFCFFGFFVFFGFLEVFLVFDQK